MRIAERKTSRIEMGKVQNSLSNAQQFHPFAKSTLRRTIYLFMELILYVEFHNESYTCR